MSQRVSDLKPSINSTLSDYDESDDSDDERTPLGVSLGRSRRILASARGFDDTHIDGIQKFRLKYLCRNSWAKCFRHSWRRLPSGKATYFILFMCFLERLSYYIAVADVVEPFLELGPLKRQSSSMKSIIKNVLLFMPTQLMFPFVGWLADVWVGRYRMIHIGLWFMWLGYASLALTFSFEAGDIDNDATNNLNRYSLVVSFVIINLGSTAFQANAIPFGADQMAYKSSEELSSYFYCYYWVRNFALLLSVSFSCSQLPNSWYGIVFGYISTFGISVALALNAMCSKHFFVNIERRNPLKTISKVCYSALVTKRPQYRSAFSYGGANPPSRIDLVKRIHGGRFTTEDVEDTKTFGRLLLFSMALVGALIVWNGIIGTFSLQEDSMLHGNDFKFKVHVLKGCTNFSILLTVELFVILLAIPLFNSCVFPFLREYTPNMLRRIGLGYILAILSVIALLVITIVGQEQLKRHHKELQNVTCVFSRTKDAGDLTPLPISVYYSIIPNSLMIFAEIFLNISSLEFFYAQSPHTMRGMMVGIYFFVWGLSSTVVNLILFGFSSISPNYGSLHRGPRVTCQMWYYLLMLLILLLSFMVYVLVARWYRKRKRLTEQEDEVFYRP